MELKNGETILYSIEADNLVDNKKNICNINMKTLVALFGLVGGEEPIKFNIVLTNKNLYLEAFGVSSWGRLLETRYIEKIDLKEIHRFSVTLNGQFEMINIDAKKSTKLYLRRDNKKLDNIGQKMVEVITALQKSI